jgi:dTDP-4-amino-4,6-dideoxygalactose transaminase
MGTKYAVAVSSGTAALRLALLAYGIGEGDEVITTPFSFIASANAILFAGARPVFADIDAQTFNIDPVNIKEKITPKYLYLIPDILIFTSQNSLCKACFFLLFHYSWSSYNSTVKIKRPEPNLEVKTTKLRKDNNG